MNYQQKNNLRKAIKGLFSTSYPEGTVKWSNETIEHFRTKCEVLAWFKSRGYDVWSEVSFKSYGRADLVCLSGTICYIVEILKSETEKMLKEKIEDYPDIMIIPIKVKDWNYSTFTI